MIPEYHLFILKDTSIPSFVPLFFLHILEGCVLYKRWVGNIVVSDMDIGC